MGIMPERLGNYRLTRLVHSGAQTEIWQAMSINMNEPWVLKVKSPKMLSQPEAARRLRHEFSVASGLKHTNTLRVNDFGNEQGFAYLSMQRFNGRSLRQLLKEMDRSLIDENLPLIIDQACAAISRLHQAGWIHTSLKPNHLMIDTDARLRLIDFSSAQPIKKRLLPTGGTSVKWFGSLYYVSPEQIRKQRLDVRSDIYSFGCLLYEMIQGRVPFTGANSQELLQKHVQAKVPRITVRSRYVTDALADLLAAMMAKEPAQRPAEMLFVQHEMRGIFQQADPVDWNRLIEEPDFELEDSEALEQRARQHGKSSAQSVDGSQQPSQPGRLHQLGTRLLQRFARLASRRWVQVSGVAALLLLVLVWGPRRENDASERQVLDQFQQIVRQMEQSPEDLQSVQLLVDQALDLQASVIPAADPAFPWRTELFWASQVLPRAVSEAKIGSPEQRPATNSLRVHLNNAQKYLDKAQEQRAAQGFLGLRPVYESDMFFWGIVVLDILGAAWIAKLLHFRKSS